MKIKAKGQRPTSKNVSFVDTFNEVFWETFFNAGIYLLNDTQTQQNKAKLLSATAKNLRNHPTSISFRVKVLGQMSQPMGGHIIRLKDRLSLTETDQLVKASLIRPDFTMELFERFIRSKVFTLLQFARVPTLAKKDEWNGAGLISGDTSLGKWFSKKKTNDQVSFLKRLIQHEEYRLFNDDFPLTSYQMRSSATIKVLTIKDLLESMLYSKPTLHTPISKIIRSINFLIERKVREITSVDADRAEVVVAKIFQGLSDQISTLFPTQ